MNGSENDPGIIHRAGKDVFPKTLKASDREFLIRVYYMEIYNEDINYLFAVENQKLLIHESLERGVFDAGLREEIVNSADQVLKLIELGEANMHFGEINMNARSSGSHTIFRMVIESKGKDSESRDSSSSDDAIRVSFLNLVDLAGSERVAKTGAGVDDAQKFYKLTGGLNVIRISQDDQEHIFEMLAAVLWLGNIVFHVIDNENYIEVVVDEAVTNAACLLGCATQDLVFSLSTHSIQAGKDKVAKKLTLQQAMYTRDSLSKFIYASLFNWLVEKINLTLATGKQHTERSISILDN